ncbi:MAG: DUF342 domain-containing protein [Firmicutes bacterium]|nr:DUF342 domain-containing protein [Bacillota bacterium]
MSGLAGEHPRSKGESGTVFLAVLVAVAVLGVLAAAAMAIAANAYKASTWARDRAKALYAAEAGINRWLFLCDSREATPSDLDGSIDGVAYTVSCAQSSDDASVYLVRSSASTGWHTCEVSVAAKSSPEAWQHVVFAAGNLNPPRVENVEPASGPNGPVTGLALPDVPSPDWGAYRALLEPDISWVTPGVPPLSGNLGEVRPVGSGPHYYRNANISRIVGPVYGDVYLSGCNVTHGIIGPVFGSILIKSSNINGPIVGRISGSVCIQGGNVSGIGDADSVIDGDVKMSAGVNIRQGGISGEIKGNVYLDGGNLEVSGATVGGSLYTGGNATLSDGCTLLGGAFCEGNLHLRDEVVIGHKDNLPAIMAKGNVNIQQGLHSTVSVDGVVWVNGNLNKGGGALEIKRGNLVIRGNANLTGNGRYDIRYDYGLLRPENQPPHFTGGKTRLSLLRDTWRSSYQSAE